MNLIRKIILGLGITAAALCLGAIVLFNWSVTGWKALAVPTGSMSPSISPGSLVLMHSVPNASLKVGDVITYANPLQKGSSITHRITQTYKLNDKIPAFITKGDDNQSPDRPVVGGQVKGKVIWSIPYIGKALIWTHTLAGLLIIIYLPAFMVMFEEVRRLMAYYKTLLPYKAAIIMAREKALAEQGRHRFAAVSAISVLLVAGSVFMAYPVQALLKSNTVALVNNRLTVARVTPPTNPCTGTGNSTTISVTGTGSGTVNIGNSNNQNATSGNATSTNGGSATSGNATNCNSTTVNITVR